jgi:hypothetical protein
MESDLRCVNNAHHPHAEPVYLRHGATTYGSVVCNAEPATLHNVHQEAVCILAQPISVCRSALMCQARSWDELPSIARLNLVGGTSSPLPQLLLI